MQCRPKPTATLSPSKCIRGIIKATNCQMIELHRQGKLPFDRLKKLYGLDDINRIRPWQWGPRARSCEQRCAKHVASTSPRPKRDDRSFLLLPVIRSERLETNGEIDMVANMRFFVGRLLLGSRLHREYEAIRRRTLMRRNNMLASCDLGCAKATSRLVSCQ